MNVKGEGVADARFIYDPKELVWLEPLVKAAFPSVSFGEHGLGAKNYANGAVGRIELTDRYFRAIAKIGFHYFLSRFPTYDGSESFFTNIGEFIIDDTSQGMDRINDFIGERTNPLLGPMMEGFRPDGWRAHVLCAEIGSEYSAHVQLFVFPDYRAPVYTVWVQIRAVLQSARQATSISILRKGLKADLRVRLACLRLVMSHWLLH